MLSDAGDDGGWVMSLDGVSQNNTHLNVSAPHLTKIDAFVRRSASNDAPSNRPARFRLLRSTENAASPRRYPRYVPAANVSQALLDFLLIGSSQLVVLSLIYSRLALGGLVQASAVGGFSIVISMVFLYATGGYRRDAV